jgi:hypothetical protein
MLTDKGDWEIHRVREPGKANTSERLETLETADQGSANSSSSEDESYSCQDPESCVVAILQAFKLHSEQSWSTEISLDGSEDDDYVEDADSIYHLPTVTETERNLTLSESQLEKGTRVEVYFEDGCWYRGTVSWKYQGAGTWQILFDNGNDLEVDFVSDCWRWPDSDQLHPEPIK